MGFTTRLGLRSRTARLSGDATRSGRGSRLVTGLSPSRALRPGRSPPRAPPRRARPARPQFEGGAPPDSRSGLFPLRSPLLGESRLVALPPPSNMLKSGGCSRPIRGRAAGRLRSSSRGRPRRPSGRPPKRSPAGRRPSSSLLPPLGSGGRIETLGRRVPLGASFRPTLSEREAGPRRGYGPERPRASPRRPPPERIAPPLGAFFPRGTPRSGERADPRAPRSRPGAGARRCRGDARTGVPPRRTPGAPSAFEASMTRRIPRFAPAIAFRRVLRRRESRDVRRREW